MAENNNTTAFQNLEQLFAAFHEIGEAQYETGAVTNEEIARFARAKEDYLRRNPQDKEKVNADIERFLNNDLENGRDSQTEMFGGFTYTFDEAFRNRYHTVEEEALKNMPPYFENRNQLFIAFHEIGEAQYTAVVSDEEITRFIAAKEEYLLRNPQEKEEIDNKIDRFLQNLDQEEMFGNFPYVFNDAEIFRKRFHGLEEDYKKSLVVDQPAQEQEPLEIVKETRRVPDLAQSVLQMGFNNQGIEDRLRAVVHELPDGHEKEMFSKVLEAYIERNNAHTVNALKVVALNDLIVNEADIEIAKRITATLGWWEGDYPETDREIEVQRTVVEPPVHIVDGPTPTPVPELQPEPEPQPVPVMQPEPVTIVDQQPELEQEPEILGRLRSAESDMNAYQLDFISYSILRSMNKMGDLEPEKIANADELYKAVKEATDNLSEDENREFNDNFVTAIADNKQALEGVPPSVLAKSYRTFTAKIAAKEYEILKEQDEQKKEQLYNEREELLRKKSKIAERIDELTDMLVADTHDDKDLFFADDTNVADVYDGYEQMFKARSEDLQSQQDENNPNQQIEERLQKMQAGQRALDEQYASYLDTYGLANVNKDSANALNNRYDEMEKGLAKVQLNDETAALAVMQNDNGQDITLGQLLSSVRFYDEQGNLEPQFKDKDGNLTTEWSQGAKVIEGSKLDQTIAMAKQQFVQDNLASNEELKSEDLQKALTDYVPQILYAVNVKSLIEKNVLETPDQYKDRDTINRNVMDFVRQFGDSNRPMEIADHTFTNTKNSIVNQAYAYRGVLAKQLNVTNDDNIDKTPILHKVCNHVKPLDSRPSSREIKTVTPNVWKNYASETLQGMAAAAIGTARVKGAQLVAIGMAHAATGIATAQLALAASAIVPVALTVKQITSWRKQQKAQGKPAGFKAMIKDKNMRWTLATTALTEAAVGCMFVPGAQPVGVALGVAALGIGVTRAASNDYKKLRAAGKSKVKAGIAAAMGAGLKIGTAILVNNAMTSLFNNYFGSKVEHKEGETKTEKHTEIRESAELQAGARHTLESFYKGNPDGLQHDLDQVRTQLHAMGRDDISPEVFLRNACDAGMNTGTNTINHIDGGGITHTHGNNLVLTDAWAQQHNVDANSVHALGGIKAPDGTITITEDALKGFDAVKYNISTINEVGSTVNADGSRLAGHQDGVLDRNATVNDDGKTVHAPQGEGKEFNTYANGENGYMQYTTTVTTNTPPHDVNVPVDYDAPMAVGMLGIRNGGWIHKMAERAGSLLDRIVGHKKKDPAPRPEPKPTPAPIVNPTPRPEPKPIPVPQPQQVEDVLIKRFLNEEYQMLYGYKPTQDDKQYQAYCKRVDEELKAEPQGKDMLSFLKERRQKIDDVVEASLSGYLGSDKGQKDLKHLQGYGDHLPETSKVLKDFNDKHANSPLTNAIRQDFWQNKNKPADEWRFDDYIKSAENYLKRNSKDLDRDAAKAPLRRIDGAKPKGRE